jgi:hypothetical protein
MCGLWIAVLASLAPSTCVAQFRLRDPITEVGPWEEVRRHANRGT